MSEEQLALELIKKAIEAGNLALEFISEAKQILKKTSNVE